MSSVEGFSEGYDDHLDPSTLNSFTAGAFRSFHSMAQGFINFPVRGDNKHALFHCVPLHTLTVDDLVTTTAQPDASHQLLRTANTQLVFTSRRRHTWLESSAVPRVLPFVDQDQKSRPGFPLREWFDRTTILQEDDKFDLMTRGMTSQPSQAMDEFVSEDLTNFLFKHKNSFGLDLESLDIQRGRDHGLAPYNDFRELCGLPRANNFSDLTDHIDEQRVELLSQHYLHVDDVDLFVGGRLERLIPGTLAGITFQCIMGEQFFRWKFGDRWFYDFKENPASFTLVKPVSQVKPAKYPDNDFVKYHRAIPLQRPLLPTPAREDHEQQPVEDPELQVQQPVVLVDNTGQVPAIPESWPLLRPRRQTTPPDEAVYYVTGDM
uniref:Peroxidase n=1 Tax=Timema bartmani TaxID=61472 RepID=A0A7R9I4K1_9NEOP|nr:unnamed protein product [Timema bartmani]